MATIELRLSQKVQKETGRSEIMIRFFFTAHDLYSRSEVYINPSFFEYYIDRKKTVNPKKPIPQNKVTATKALAAKNGWELRNSGVITIGKLIETDDIIYHKGQSKRIDEIKQRIIDEYEKVDKESITKDWLKDIVDRYNHPEKYMEKVKSKTFYELGEDYIKKHKMVDGHARVYRVLFRAVARYEGFIRATDAKRKNYTWDINTVTREDIEDLTDYLRNEKALSEEYPTIFKTLFANYPPSVKPGNSKIEERGDNTIIKMRTKLKALFKFFVEEGATTNRPFEGVKIGTPIVGTPVYISIEERNKIAGADLAEGWGKLTKEERQKARMPLATLEQQRDIFVFHCFVGCRVGDLMKLTEKHIHREMLVYTPHKTKDEGKDNQARVPLHEKALALIEKYKGVDKHGRLFPFITPQRYNDAIKTIFKLAGVTRNVEIRNSLTGEPEIVPINTIASSHLARRTFVGNLYFRVQDPNLIGKMSGHVEGSEAFKRYRKIEDSTLRDVINQIG